MIQSQNSQSQINEMDCVKCVAVITDKVQLLLQLESHFWKSKSDKLMWGYYECRLFQMNNKLCNHIPDNHFYIGSDMELSIVFTHSLTSSSVPDASLKPPLYQNSHTTKPHTLLLHILGLGSRYHLLNINTHISQSPGRSLESGQWNIEHSFRGRFTYG